MKNYISSNMSCFGSTTEIGNKKIDGSEIKSGRLCLIQPFNGRVLRVQVFVRVYRSCFEHYAILYKDQKYSLQSGYVSLKNCIVSECTGKANQFRVTLNDYEGTGLMFESATGEEMIEWLKAFQTQILASSPPKSSIPPSLSPIIPRSPLMPTLAEEESDDD